jgi:hypothetical protein
MASNNTWAQSLSASIAAGQYYEFRIEPAAGQTMSLEALSFSVWMSNPDADCGIGVRVSLDGSNYQDVNATGTYNTENGYTANLSSLAGMLDRTAPVTVRIYTFGSPPYNATAIGMGTSATDLRVLGSAKSIPALAASTINDGQPQRSVIRTIRLDFNTLVNLSATALELRPQAGGAAVPISWTTQDSSGQTVAIVQIPLTLADGRFRLVVQAAQVSHRAGGVLMTANAEVLFHRLFGDANGDGVVDPTDFTEFSNAFGQTVADSPFDYNGDGSVDPSDFTEFSNRFGMTV